MSDVENKMNIVDKCRNEVFSLGVIDKLLYQEKYLSGGW